MIRYAIELADIEQRIDTALPATLTSRGVPRKGGRKSWRNRAQERTEQFRIAGFYNDPDGAEFWGEVKAVFAKVQRNKCAYCETCLHNRSTGTVDGGVDHFRPKRAGDAFAADVLTGGSHSGYHLLAYHPGNYVLTCRPCNEDYKKAFFPIASRRVAIGDSPIDYAAEEPYLLYPLGDKDTNPEEIFQFTGIVADPLDSKASNSHNYWRARITIELFNLNGRDDLRKQRAEVIEAVYLALTSNDSRASSILYNMLSEGARHANCARSFQRLFEANEHQARQLAEEAIATNKQLSGA